MLDDVNEVRKLDDVTVTLSEFHAAIDHALMAGDEWLETSEPIIRYYNKNTLCPKGQPELPMNMPGKPGCPFYFIYKNIKVCMFGKSQEIEHYESIPQEERIFGKESGIVVNAG